MTPRIVMPTVVLILAPFAFAADPPGSILGKNAAREAPKPKLVAKTSDALVHALPHDDDTWSQPVPGFRLLFTHLATGEMETLFSTGTTSDHKRRATYFQTRLLGAVADDQRLYVLVATVTMMDHVPPATQAIPMDQFKKDNASRNKAAIHFRVYWLKDGSRLIVRELTSGLPKEMAKEATDAGPLTLVKNGVKFYDNTVTFDGKTEDGAK